MENDNYEKLRSILVLVLADLEQARKHGFQAVHLAEQMDGILKKEVLAFLSNLEKISYECMKLEQQTREI